MTMMKIKTIAVSKAANTEKFMAGTPSNRSKFINIRTNRRDTSAPQTIPASNAPKPRSTFSMIK
ncbi:hypothetical protein D3C78_704820 [compost metagenome]